MMLDAKAVSVIKLTLYSVSLCKETSPGIIGMEEYLSTRFLSDK